MLSYKINGLDLKTTYGITVRKQQGAFDFLKRKGDLSQSFPDADGEVAFTDANDIFYEPRKIYLTCTLEAASQAIFIAKLNQFKFVLEYSGLLSLTIPPCINDFIVYFSAGGSVELLTKWNSTLLVGNFILEFTEPVPARGGKV